MAKKQKTIRKAVKKALGKTYNAADIQKILENIEKHRKELQKVPRNKHYWDKKAEIAKKINILKQELWALEVKEKPKE